MKLLILLVILVVSEVSYCKKKKHSSRLHSGKSSFNLAHENQLKQQIERYSDNE